MKELTTIVVATIQVLLSLTVVSARNQVGPLPRASIPCPRQNKVAGLCVRGGAGPLNAKDTAKVAAYVLGAQGAYAIMAPAKANEHLGVPSNEITDFITQRAGVLIVSLVLLVREVVFNGGDAIRAAGISSIPAGIHLLQIVLSGECLKLGLKAPVMLFSASFFGLVAYTCLTGSKYGDAMAKACTIWHIFFTFLPLYFLPEMAAKFFGGAKLFGPGGKVLGIAHLSEGIILAALLWGKNIDAIKAVGYGWIPWVFLLADVMFLKKEALNSNLAYLSLIFHSIVALTLAF